MSRVTIYVWNHIHIYIKYFTHHIFTQDDGNIFRIYSIQTRTQQYEHLLLSYINHKYTSTRLRAHFAIRARERVRRHCVYTDAILVSKLTSVAHILNYTKIPQVYLRVRCLSAYINAKMNL